MERTFFFIACSLLIFQLFKYKWICKTSPLTTLHVLYVTEQFKAVKCQNKQDKPVTMACFPTGREALSAPGAFSICSEVPWRKIKTFIQPMLGNLRLVLITFRKPRVDVYVYMCFYTRKTAWIGPVLKSKGRCFRAADASYYNASSPLLGRWRMRNGEVNFWSRILQRVLWGRNAFSASR